MREASNLSGYRIEQRLLPGPLTDTGNLSSLFVDDFNGPKSGVLFREEFGSNALDHYTLVDEAQPTIQPHVWTVTDSSISQTGNFIGVGSSLASPDKPGTIAVTGSSNWGNVRIAAYIKI